MPVYVAWKCYPERKGLVTSLIFCCFGLGTISASLISTYIVNPDNINATIKVDLGETIYSYYTKEVTNNVPKLFQIFALGYSCLLLFSFYNIWIPEEDCNENVNET